MHRQALDLVMFHQHVLLAIICFVDLVITNSKVQIKDAISIFIFGFLYSLNTFLAWYIHGKSNYFRSTWLFSIKFLFFKAEISFTRNWIMKMIRLWRFCKVWKWVFPEWYFSCLFMLYHRSSSSSTTKLRLFTSLNRH